MLLQFIINGIIIGAIYALVGTGFSIIYSTSKIFHIAYSLLYMVVGYFAYTLSHDLNLPFILSATVSLIGVVLLSILIEKLVYQTLKNRRANHNSLLIASLGVMIIGINVIALSYGNETKILNNDIAKSITFGEVIITYPQIYQLVISVLLLSAFYLLLKFTPLGLKIKAVKDNSELSKYHGINVSRLQLILFAFSGIMAGAAGLLMSYDIGFDPYVGLPMLLNAIVAMIIGGNKYFYTILLGGMILGLIQSLVVWQFSSNWQEGITFTILILFLIFRPLFQPLKKSDKIIIK